MKKQLRNMMLAGAATLLAGNAWAAGTTTANEGFDLKLDWETPATLPNAESRFGTANRLTGEILVSQKAEKKVYAFTAEGMTVKYDLSGTITETMATAITCDDAGNVLVNQGWAGAASNTSWWIIPAESGVAGAQQLNLTVDGETGRTDCVGRTIGNVMGEEGGFFSTVPNGKSAALSFYIASGEMMESYASVAYPADFNTPTAVGVAQPWGQTVEEQINASDPSSAIYVYNYTASKYLTPDVESGEFVVAARPGAASGYGFDIFVVNDVEYGVIGTKVSANYSDSFCIFRVSDGEVIAQYNNPDSPVTSALYQSLIAYPNEDGKSVSIYEYRVGTAARKFTFTIGGEVPPTPAPLYILGDQNNWDAAAPTEFVYDSENGVYTHKLVDAPYGFKISTAKGDWDAFDGAGFHIDGALQANTVTPLLSGAPGNGGNITLAMPGDYTIVVDLNNMTIEAKGTATVTAPDQFFVIGQLSIGAWDPSKGVELTKNGYIFEGDVAMAGGYFSFTEKLSPVAGNAGWSQMGQRYGAATSDQETHLNSPLPFMKGENAFNIVDYTEYPQNVHFVVDFEKMTVTISTATGVEDIAVDAAAPAEYYNLQGIRVAQPESGKLYIVKKGDKVSKMLVK